jgi:hypothetical protein
MTTLIKNTFIFFIFQHLFYSLMKIVGVRVVGILAAQLFQQFFSYIVV